MWVKSSSDTSKSVYGVSHHIHTFQESIVNTLFKYHNNQSGLSQSGVAGHEIVAYTILLHDINNRKMGIMVKSG